MIWVFRIYGIRKTQIQNRLDEADKVIYLLGFQHHNLIYGKY